MQQLTNKQKAFKNQLIKKLHAMVATKGISDDQYRAALSGFNVETSKDLNIKELIMLISLISELDPSSDLWRKRCIAAIGAWLKAVNRDGNDIDLIKSIACRASGYVRFNKIPTSRLRDIYYEFTRKSKVNANAKIVTDELVNLQTLMN